jgi:hypothetical protein
MDPFDVAVAFRVVIRRAAVCDAEPRERFYKLRRSELCAVVRGQCYVRLAAALGQPFQLRLLDRGQRALPHPSRLHNRATLRLPSLWQQQSSAGQDWQVLQTCADNLLRMHGNAQLQIQEKEGVMAHETTEKFGRTKRNA